MGAPTDVGDDRRPHQLSLFQGKQAIGAVGAFIHLSSGKVPPIRLRWLSAALIFC